MSVLCDEGWVSGTETVLLNLLLDRCLVMTGEVRWFLAEIFSLALVSVSRGFG